MTSIHYITITTVLTTGNITKPRLTLQPDPMYPKGRGLLIKVNGNVGLVDVLDEVVAEIKEKLKG